MSECVKGRNCLLNGMDEKRNGWTVGQLDGWTVGQLDSWTVGQLGY
jgi:hypothetical protein